MHKLAVYIVVAIAVILFIAAGIVLIMHKATLNNKKDLFTDMNEYYTNSTIAAPLTHGTIYPNVSLNQHEYLINFKKMDNSLQ